MQYILSKQFEKDFSKLPKGTKSKAVAAFQRFIKNPDDVTLRNHELTGKLKNYYSINVTGDIRALYTFVESDLVQFVAIGSHSKLYG